MKYYNEYKNLNQEELNEALVSACYNHDLGRVKYLISSPELKFNANSQYNGNMAFRTAIENNSADIIKYLSDSKELKNYIDIRPYSIKLLEVACQTKDYNWIEDLLPIAIEHSKYSVFLFIHKCCEFGNLDIVKYLLESSHWSKQFIIDNGLFNSACRGDNVELIEYLLNSKWKDKFDVHDDYDLPFITCCESKSIAISEYFILELNIEKSFPIDEYLKENDCEFNRYINTLFLSKELNQSLKSDFKQEKKRIKL
jgi:hypothetical protein